MGAIVNKNPFMATYGQKAKMWEEAINLAHERGFCLTHKEPTLRKKVEAILNAHQVCTSVFHHVSSNSLVILESALDFSCAAISGVDN
jgi:hypothetical protein